MERPLLDDLAKAMRESMGVNENSYNHIKNRMVPPVQYKQHGLFWLNKSEVESEGNVIRLSDSITDTKNWVQFQLYPDASVSNIELQGKIFYFPGKNGSSSSDVLYGVAQKIADEYGLGRRNLVNPAAYGFSKSIVDLDGFKEGFEQFQAGEKSLTMVVETEKRNLEEQKRQRVDELYKLTLQNT